jgi:hypothetical protein
MPTKEYKEFPQMAQILEMSAGFKAGKLKKNIIFDTTLTQRS